MVFYVIYHVSHKAHHATHNAKWLGHIRPDAQLNLVMGYFHIFIHMLLEMRIQVGSPIRLACGMAKALQPSATVNFCVHNILPRHI